MNVNKITDENNHHHDKDESGHDFMGGVQIKINLPDKIYHMKALIKISSWAKRNPWPSRVMIVVSHLLLTAFAILLGWILIELRITLPSIIFLSAVLIFSFGVIIYPLKAEKRVKYGKIEFYKKQKFADLLLVTSTFLIILQGGNSYFSNEMKPIEKVWSIAAKACYVKVTPPETVASAIDNPSEKQVEKNITDRKEKRSNLKSKLGNILSEINNSNDGGKAGLGILLIIGSLGLLFLVVALACNLSCSGAEGAAIMVGILGGAAIIFLLLKAFKLMGKKKNGATPYVSLMNYSSKCIL